MGKTYRRNNRSHAESREHWEVERNIKRKKKRRHQKDNWTKDDQFNMDVSLSSLTDEDYVGLDDTAEG